MPPPPTPPRPQWPMPKFSLRIEDLSHPGVKLFLQSVDPHKVMVDACTSVFQWLYGTVEVAPKNVQEIHLVLRPMEGVAYTTGTHTNKQIHLSCQHIVNNTSRTRHEIYGVLTHEVVHCFQYNAKGSCPGGFVEGIADWVRLHASLSPPHWQPRSGPQWDAGYDTTAYFLAWLEDRFGSHVVPTLNELMKDKKYDEIMFGEVTGSGMTVEELWSEYCASVDKGGVRRDGKGALVVQER